MVLKVLVFRVLAKLLMIKLTKPRRRQRAEKCGGLAIRDTDTQSAAGPGDQTATCALCRNNQSASKRLVNVFVDALDCSSHHPVLQPGPGVLPERDALQPGQTLGQDQPRPGAAPAAAGGGGRQGRDQDGVAAGRHDHRQVRFR